MPRAATKSESLVREIEAVGRALRDALVPLIEGIDGSPARPSRFARTAGIDKSLASRLTRAVRTDTDLQLVHIVPSPTGLRIFADAAAGLADPGRIAELTAAADRFQYLLDSTPGGRSAIDAQISSSSMEVRTKREHIAKQASFKAMSFLLGHFCETLVTQIFLVPARNGRTVDAIEIQRRIGLERMVPGVPLALLSFFQPPEDEIPETLTWIDTIGEELGSTTPRAFLLPEFSSEPMPPIDIVNDDDAITLVLGGESEIQAPTVLTSAMCIRNGWPRDLKAGLHTVRGYILHVPCRTLVRDLYVADGLFEGISPRVSFNMPGPGANTHPPHDDQPPHFAAVNLTSSIEQRPTGARAWEIPGVSDMPVATRHALETCGHGETRFRGWRCSMTYPVPLVEMVWWMAFPNVV